MRTTEEISKDYQSFIGEQQDKLSTKLDTLQSELNLSTIRDYFVKNDIDYNEELLEYSKENISKDNFYYKESNGKIIFKTSTKLDSDTFYIKFVESLVKKYDIKLIDIQSIIEKAVKG